MTEISHFLAPGGWKIDFKDPKNAVCTKLLPKPGTTLLIGRSRKRGACTVVWMDDSSGNLRTLDNLVCKGAYWEAVIRAGNKYFVITAWKAKGTDGTPRIAGDIEEGRKSNKLVARAAAWKPGTDFNTQGTWGAEANPGGGKG
ncbi:MAG TPA: hypothetical protein VNW71_20570 [Thermoanaerobaculia bacterium]|nr:hypothetical protein [Thermoanaerobaculia bacterium]